MRCVAVHNFTVYQNWGFQAWNHISVGTLLTLNAFFLSHFTLLFLDLFMLGWCFIVLLSKIISIKSCSVLFSLEFELLKELGSIWGFCVKYFAAWISNWQGMSKYQIWPAQMWIVIIEILLTAELLCIKNTLVFIVPSN